MEQEPKCKCLTAIYQNEKLMLESQNTTELDIEKDNKFHISVEQCGIRRITIKSNEDVSVFKLHTVFSRVERLLMLFDGIFLPLSKIHLYESDTATENMLSSCEAHFMIGRLSYFSSAKFCKYSANKLLGFDAVLTTELFYKWEKLLDELDVVHQMYLYSLSDSGMTADVKCAFLIELSEPLIEIVKSYTNFFPSLNPGSNGTSLKECLDALITKYGVDIFKNEISNNYKNFLSVMVWSRVRIMHIKRKQKKMYFDGRESVLYVLKISLLYRRILFEILNINETIYKDNLLKCVSRLDKWDGILERFLFKLSRKNYINMN